jgi:hypothetical protein
MGLVTTTEYARQLSKEIARVFDLQTRVLQPRPGRPRVHRPFSINNFEALRYTYWDPEVFASSDDRGIRQYETFCLELLRQQIVRTEEQGVRFSNLVAIWAAAKSSGNSARTETHLAELQTDLMASIDLTPTVRDLVAALHDHSSVEETVSLYTNYRFEIQVLLSLALGIIVQPSYASQLLSDQLSEESLGSLSVPDTNMAENKGEDTDYKKDKADKKDKIF